MERSIRPVDPGPWWLERELFEGTGQLLELGGLRLGLFHLPGEWQVSQEHVPQPSLDREAFSIERLEEVSGMPGEIERFALGAGGDRVSIVPVVADRSVIARPRLPLHVPPNQEVEIFVSSPVWLQIALGDPPVVLPEIPVSRLSDTWFGPSTREGELAYALGTQARVRLEQVPRRPHRMITPVVIENRDGAILKVERLSLPIPFLSVFADAEDQLWTEAVRFRSRAGNDLVDFEIPSAPSPSLRKITGPRRAGQKNLLVRAFAGLLRPFGMED